MVFTCRRVFCSSRDFAVVSSYVGVIVFLRFSSCFISVFIFSCNFRALDALTTIFGVFSIWLQIVNLLAFSSIGFDSILISVCYVVVALLRACCNCSLGCTFSNHLNWWPSFLVDVPRSNKAMSVVVEAYCWVARLFVVCCNLLLVLIYIYILKKKKM
jgi:hypothetical protein